ncbi:MAG: alkaline phosphatase family protein [bacterium]|nr:alkaline phosphatase family protein [bacterium]
MDDPTPSYDGVNLANLAAELEVRLTGRSPTQGLRPELADLIPHTRNYLLLIIDGLGDQQLAHPAAATLRQHRRAALTAPFPTTTSVGLSSVTTALAPMQHGVIGYTQWMPTLRTVVNMLEWVDMATGQAIDLDPVGFHPSPNLPERLSAAGVRTMIFQPTELLDTPVSNMLCRGAERHGYSSPFDIRPPALSSDGNRTLTVVYTAPVDTAAHAYRQRSQAYSTALSQTGQVWEHFRRSLPLDTTLIGSADHGHCDIPPDRKMYLDENLANGLQWWGDGRLLMFRGPLEPVHGIARRTGAQFVSAEQLRRWLGGGPPHPALTEFPTAALLALPGTVIFPQYLPSPYVGHHGGITPHELLIPLLVA